MKYTKEQIDKANATDLVPFLEELGEKFKKCGKEYRWMTHDSVMINHNHWFRFSNNTGGGPIDFLMTFYDKSFPESVEMLIQEKQQEDNQKRINPTVAKADVSSQEDGSIPLQDEKIKLPEVNVNSDIVRKYLIEERGIAEKIVDQMISERKIYEDRQHHNVIFVGYDTSGNIRYAGIRGTQEKYRGEAAGSEKAYGFGHTGDDDTLFVFEAPIDLLSFLTARRRLAIS